MSMNRLWLTLILALLFGSLAAYVYFIDLPAERAALDRAEQDQNLLSFAETAITGLAVRTGSEEVTMALQPSGTWRITVPIVSEADAQEVNNLVRALVLGKINRVVDDNPATLAPFGLEHPSVVIAVKTDTQEETLSIGDLGPISSTLYAMRGTDKRVLLTNLAVKDVLSKGLLTFRKKEVVTFEETRVERLRLTYPPTEYLLDRNNREKPAKWDIRFPVETAADQTEVRTLLLRLQALKALGFIDAPAERAKLTKRLTKPSAKITLYTAGQEQTVRLFQGGPTSGEAYAVSDPEGPIFRISPLAVRDLTKDLFTLRDKRLLGIDLNDVAILAVKTRDESFVLINQTDRWVFEDDPSAKVNQETAALFVSRVVNLPAEIQVLKQTGQLAAYGLSSPTAEFTATAKDGRQRGHLVLGLKTGGLVYARGKGLPGIYQARADLLDQIPTRGALLTPSASSEGASS